jgi:hypothetical protein
LKVIEERIIKLTPKEKTKLLKELEKEYNNILQKDLTVSPDCEVFSYRYITELEIKDNFDQAL